MFNSQDVEVLTFPYKYIHEETEEVVGIQSTLLNLGLVITSTEIDYDRIATHLKTARTKKLEEIPTIYLSMSTESLNALNYYYGFVAISMTENDHPVIGINISQRTQVRTRMNDEWVEGYSDRSVEMTLALIDGEPLTLEACGHEFKPQHLSDGTLLQFVRTLALELGEYSRKIPTWEKEEEVKKGRFLRDTLASVSMNRVDNPEIGIHGIFAPWSVVSWDKGLEVSKLRDRFYPTQYKS